MQKILDDYLVVDNTRRPHRGRGMNGRTPAAAFIEGLKKPTLKRMEKSDPENQPQQTAA